MNKIFKVDSDVCETVGVKEITCDLHDFYFGEKITLTVDGKQISRKVYDDAGGLYVSIKGCKVYYEDFN